MRPLSKKDRFILRAVDAGFKNFEAESFIHVLARFEHSIRAEYEVVAWMDSDEHLMHDRFKNDPEKQKLSMKEQPFSGYDTPLYRHNKK